MMAAKQRIERYEILVSGSGGQGVLLTGEIIAESAVREGLQVAQTASYGPESRGGASQSDVIISTEPIDYPGVLSPNFLIALTQEAADAFANECADDAIILLDATWVETIPEFQAKLIYHVPITKEAAKRYGKPIYANLIAIGFLTAETEIFHPVTVIDVIREKVPVKTIEQNLSAFHFGLEMSKEVKPVQITRQRDIVLK